MAHRYLGRHLTMAWRLFWRCVAGVLVFAQVAVAADLCVSVGNDSKVPAQTIAGTRGQGPAHADCVTDLAVPDQARAADPGNLLSEPGPPSALGGAWPLPSQPSARRMHYVAPDRAVSPTLLFLKLRL